jgi:hypothetical protein
VLSFADRIFCIPAKVILLGNIIRILIDGFISCRLEEMLSMKLWEFFAEMKQTLIQTKLNETPSTPCQ